MATERDRYELGFDLVGGPEFESTAERLLDLVKRFQATLNSLNSTAGGKIGAAQLFESAAVGNFDQQVGEIQKAELALKEYRAELLKTAEAAQARFEAYQPTRRTNQGELYAQDARKQDRLRDAALKAQDQVENENLKEAHLRNQLEKAITNSLRGLANATQARLKREQAENGPGSPNFIAQNALSRADFEAYKQPLTPIISGEEPQRARVALAQAQAELAAIERRYTQIYERNQAGLITEGQTKDQLNAVQRQYTAALQRGVIAQERVDAESGGFFSQFSRGFRGASDRPYAEQLGQAVKFSAFYGAAYRLQFALLQTFRDALTQGIEFQQGLSDMALATGRSKGELTTLADNLAEIAAATGQAPGAGVQTGARAIGLYGATNASLDQQSYIAQLSTSIVGKLAFGTKQDPLTLQQNLASITSAAGLGANGQVLIANLDAYFSKRFGTTPGETLEAGAQSASAGIAAGFTPEQIQALAALIISRTGQTSSAVGGYLAQIFTRGGEGSLTTSAETLGIKTNGRNLAQVFKDLATLYQEADAQTRTKIAATLGRGKVQSAGIAALENYPEVLQAAQAAQDGAATGALDRSFAARLNNIGGQLAVLGSTFKEFARLLGDSGLLSILGLLVKTLQEFLEATNAILEVYDSVPPAIKDFISSLAVAALALRLFGTGETVFGSARNLLGARTAGTFAARGVTAAEVAAGTGATAAGAGAGIAATAAAAIPVAAAAAALLGVGSVIATLKKVDSARDAADAFLKNAPALGSGAESYRAQAEAGAAIAQQNRDADKGFLGKVAQVLTLGHANDKADRTAAQLDEEVARLQRVATDVAARDAANIDPSRNFATFDKTGIDAGLQAIANNGGSATVQLKSLTDAINGLGGSAAKARGNLDVATQGQIATGIAGNLGSALDGFDPFVSRFNTGETYDEVSASKAESAIGSQLTGTKIQKKLKKYLEDSGITNLKNLTDIDINKIANDLVDSVDYSKGDLKKVKSGDRRKIEGALQESITDYLKSVVGDYKQAITGAQPVTAGVATQIAQELTDATSARTALRPKTDYAGRIADARGLLASIHSIKIEPGGDTSQVEVLLQSAREALVQSQIDRIEALRHVAVQNAKTQAEATRLGRGFVSQELNAVIHGFGSSDQLASILALAGKSAINEAKTTINHLITIKKAQLAVEKAIANAASVLNLALSLLQPAGSTGAPNQGKIDSLQNQLNSLQGLKDSLSTDTYSENPDQKSGGGAEKPTAEEIRAARLAAEAAKRGGAIAPARAALAGAKAALDKAKKGTIEYYNALASYYQAQDSLTDAIRAYAKIRAQLRIDTTDPVAQARLDLQIARNKLAADRRRGKAPDVLAQDRLDIKNAANAAEAAKFDQRLSDVQTAESLGRISHSAYLRYLQSEHDRLSSIGHKTRQQIDELNQIDQLLKSANDELQGQFNIGDIKLPTPYQVRRYIQQTAAGVQTYAATPGGTTTIYIDGADTAKVKAIIDDTVGKSSRVLTTTTRRT